MAVLGALLLKLLNPAYIQVLMAFVLLSNLPQILRKAQDPEKSESSRLAILGIGGAAGFLSGLTGAVGVLFNRFYLSHGLTKQEIVATRATNEVLIHVAKLLIYWHLGVMDATAIRVGAIVAAGAILSSVSLKPILGKIPHALFARIGYAAMVISGAALLVTSASRVVQDDRIAVDWQPVLGGTDARIQWRNSSLTLEIEYDGGLEVEIGIPLSELSMAQQELVRALDPGSDSIATEVVYEVGRRYYEVYYLKDGRVLKKFSFDENGRVHGSS